jgi:superfamily II DNA/RNA helicase
VKKGVDILIATPGRLLTLVRGTLPQPLVSSRSFSSQQEDANFDSECELVDIKELQKLEKLSEEELEELIENGEINDVDTEQKQRRRNPPPRGPDAVIDLSRVKCVVLDEVDKMLQLGHFPDVKGLFTYLPKPQRGKETDKMQVTMMSATLVPQIEELIQRFAPEGITIDLNEDMQAAENVKNIVYLVTNRRKYALLRYLLKRRGSMKGKQCLIFCRTKQRVNRLAEALKIDNFNAEGIHRDLPLKKRQKIIESFTKGEIRCLVSTEVMARGIDVPGLPFVVNYDVPFVPEEFVHRIGRTGRAGNPGTAITLVGRQPIISKLGGRVTEINEIDYLKKIEAFLKRKLNPTKVPGPWSDDGFNDKFAEEMQKQKQLRLEQKFLRKQQKETRKKSKDDPTQLLSQKPKTKKTETSVPIDEKTEKKKEETLDYLIKKRHRILKHAIQYRLRRKNSAVLDAKRILSKEAVGLRDFKEGRFEDVVTDLEKRNARKRGVNIPPDFEERLKTIARKALKAKRKRKQKQQQNKQSIKRNKS